jgi:hypothetical protein
MTVKTAPFPRRKQNSSCGVSGPTENGAGAPRKGASKEEQLNCYRSVRDDIIKCVETLPDSLLAKEK